MELETELAETRELLAQAPLRKKPIDIHRPFPKEKPKYILEGHRGGVLAVAVHPSYQTLATASEDGTVKLWDYETGEFERTLKGHGKSVHCLAFDTQGRFLGNTV